MLAVRRQARLGVFRFRDLYEQFTLFFFTVQKFANFLESKFTNLTDFDLIIIDGTITVRRFGSLSLSLSV